MTLTEIARKLPNGFHDAEVARIELDYGQALARLHISVWVGDLSASEYSAREAYRPAILTLTGLQYFVIQPPSYAYDAETLTINVDMDHAPETIGGPFAPDAFQNRFFVSEWNAFIQVSATEAALAWSEEQNR